MQNIIKFTLKHFRFVSTPRFLLEHSGFDSYIPIVLQFLIRHKNQNTFSTFNPKQYNRPLSVEDLFKHIDEHKVFYLKLLTNIFPTIEFQTLSENQSVRLLQCCGSSVPDSSCELRNKICQEIYRNLIQSNKVSLYIYNTYIAVCTENSIALNTKEFLSSMQCAPDRNTFHLLMQNVCQKGHIQEAFSLLENMKLQQIEVDEDIFNFLVLAHTIHSGMDSGEVVIKTMRSAQIFETSRTKLFLIRGLIIRKDLEALRKALKTYTLNINNEEVLQLIQDLGNTGNFNWIPEIKHLWEKAIFDRDFVAKLKKMCIHFVHMKKPEAAMAILEEFVETDFETNYGFFLLKEMLHCQIDINVIISMTKRLKDSNKNYCALENITEVALKHEYCEVALNLLETFETLRPHYFWPILISIARKEGESGIFNIVRKMCELKVKIDFETMETYIFPFCDLTKPMEVIQIFQELGFSVREVLSPVVSTLLKENKIKEAADICTQYNVKIFGEKFIPNLCNAWNNTKNTNSTVYLLQKYCESTGLQVDIVGEFLIKILKFCRNRKDYQPFLSITQAIGAKQLRINTLSAEVLNGLCDQCPNEKLQSQIRNSIDSLLDYGLKAEVISHIPHPRVMDVNELECHYIELQEKNMNTRSVLRKLIQMHTSLGNVDRVNELDLVFKSLGHGESPGMKSSLLYNNVKSGNLEEALKMYEDINIEHPNFNLDSFKIIDLAKLLVEKDKFDKAIDLLKQGQKRKTAADPSVQKNCWNLLSACKGPSDQRTMLDCLVQNRYCKVTNVLLGPLVRKYLNSNELEQAVNFYVDCTNRYKYTPLQLELFCAVLKSEKSDLLKMLIDATETVHGGPSTNTTLVCALAENGQNAPLRKVLAGSVESIKPLLNMRCQRWIKEKKVLPLKTLAKASQKIPKEVVDLGFVYECLMEIYYLNNDWDSAEKLSKSLEEEEYFEDKNLEMKVNKMLNKFNIKVNKQNQT